MGRYPGSTESCLRPVLTTLNGSKNTGAPLGTPVNQTTKPTSSACKQALIFNDSCPRRNVHSFLRIRSCSQFHCLSYSPLPSFLYTVKPAFFASVIERGLRWLGVLKPEISFRTGRRQAGHFSSGLAVTGRRKVKPEPPQGLQSPFPSHSSYS